VRIHGRVRNESLGSAGFTLGAHRTGIVRVRLDRLGRRLLRSSQHHRISAILHGPHLSTGVRLFGT
jgi:hypothetical protein